MLDAPVIGRRAFGDSARPGYVEVTGGRAGAQHQPGIRALRLSTTCVPAAGLIVIRLGDPLT
jgi:hypothetical protein